MLENIRISIQGIWSHKMRSFLTMLGIIIGIASIIAIVSTIKGTSEQIKEDLIGAGNNTVSVSLNYGDSDYDPEYGMTDGTEPPLLSDQQKEDVMNLDHVEKYAETLKEAGIDTGMVSPQLLPDYAGKRHL